MRSLRGVSHRFIVVDGLRMHVALAGHGDPLVLLHGWPQTWFEWHKVIPSLARRYRVIAPDLRGLGASERASGGFDKKTVARDIHTLVAEELGHPRFRLVGHDWGGPVALSLALQFRDAVERLAVLDVTIPGDGVTDWPYARRRWHHWFHRTPDLPEALTAGREADYLNWFYDRFAHKPEAIEPEARDEYVRHYSALGRMRCGFEYYRAIGQDARDFQALLADGKLTIPVLALAGNQAMGRRTETAQSLRVFCENVAGGAIDNCGHFLPEEQPVELIDRLLDFFAA